MSEINLSDVNSGYNLLKISRNFEEIERVINEELLHRVNADNTLPNTLEADVDANGQAIYNLRKPLTGGEPLRVKDLFGNPDELLQGPDTENITASAGQTVFTLSTSYVPGSNSILVFRNGIYLDKSRYTETSLNTITLNTPVDVNDVISVVPVAVTGGDTGGSDINGSNVGTGAGVFRSRTGNTLSFKTIKAGTNTSISSTSDEITINATASSVTASNLGATGEGVYASKVGDNFTFKKLRAGTNVTLSSDAEGITINSSGGGGGGSSVAVYDNGTLKTSAASSFNFVNTTIGVVGSAITVTAPAAPYLTVKDYGAKGDGTTDDSAAIQAAITAAQAANRAVFFPDGTYLISTLGSQSGRIFLIGTGNSTIKGTLTYSQSSFPTSADTTTPLSTTAPFFSAEKLNFQSNSTDYALKLYTPQQPNFISTFKLTDCKFYGNKGLLAQHMIGFEVRGCEFNNVVTGTRLEGCVNGLFTSNRWQNQAEAGVYITKHATETNRAGGENMRFVNCEWAVCTWGIIADEHMWLTLDSCLLDYCDKPLFLSGANWAKAVNTYFGASNVATARFSAITGFLNPGTYGLAVHGRPSGTPLGNKVVGFTAHNCEFINYVSGSTQPIVYIDGYIDGTYPMSAEEVSFVDCLFYATQSHSALDLLEISNARIARVIANRFRSYNLSTSMSDAFRTNNVLDWQNHSNSFWNCTQSSVQVRSSYELGTGVYISSTAPSSPYPGLIWIQP